MEIPDFGTLTLSSQRLKVQCFLGKSIILGVGKQGYGNRPPIDDRKAIRKFSIDPLYLQNQCQARLLYGWRTFLVQNGYSEPRWDLSVLQSASQSVVHNISSAFTPLQGTVIKLDSSCLSLWAHNLLQGSVNINGIRILWFSYHDPLILRVLGME